MENRIASLDLLRGLAACSVVLFHFTIKETVTLSDSNGLRFVGQFGHYGVQIFFIISGFVIPYSMWAKSYEISDFGRFMMKRILRIEIPFLIIIVIEVLLIALSAMTPWRAGVSERLDLWNIILHIGYLNGFLDRPWLLPIFWTLAIEFQFYLFIALLFNLLTDQRAVFRYVIFAAMIGLSFVASRNILFFHSAFFIIGIVLFQFYVKSISKTEFMILLSMVLTFVAFTENLFIAILSGLSCLATLTLNELPSFWYRIGFFSFSIYLIHVPLGGRVLALVEILSDNESVKTIAIIITFVLVLLAARLFYHLVERPALKLSKNYGVS